MNADRDPTISDSRRLPVRLRVVVLVALLCVWPGCGPSATPGTDGRSSGSRGAARPLILAHRGLASRAPENSVAAIQAAIDLGADGVEVDVQVTADGDAVVFHDYDLGRLTARTERVRDLALAELTRIAYVDPVTGKPFNQKISSLASLLDRFGGKCLLFLELKTPGGPRAAELKRKLVERVGADLVRRGLTESTLVSSLNAELIGALEQAHPKVRTVYEFFPPQSLLEALPEALPARTPRTDWLGPSYRWVTAERVQWAKRHYKGVSTFTPNLLEEMESLAEQGVDLIQTDALEMALLWRSGKLATLAWRTLTDGWPWSGASSPGEPRPDGSVVVKLPAGTTFTVTVPARSRAINFVDFEVEALGADRGDTKLMFVVLEEEVPATGCTALAPAARVLRRGGRALVPHLQSVALHDGRARLSATFMAGSRTRSLFIAVGFEGGPHRIRFAKLAAGMVTPGDRTHAR